jgi:uncharacterized surface protein with fasciclin (FAS1) repeats
MKSLLVTLGAVGLLASGTNVANAENTNVDRALASHSDLSLFYQAMLNTGVAHELNEHTEYTIFAPTNAAFAEFQPRAYPCFYAMQCRADVSSVIRNHIVPQNESIDSFSKWGGGIPTIGTYSINVDEPYKGQYRVENQHVLDHSEDNEANRFAGEGVSLYRIDGVIATEDQMATFRKQPVAEMPGLVSQQTTTTYRHVSPVMPAGYIAPDNYATNPNVVLTPSELSDGDTETTTTTRTTTSQ